eukprot:s1091_g1.t1
MKSAPQRKPAAKRPAAKARELQIECEHGTVVVHVADPSPAEVTARGSWSRARRVLQTEGLLLLRKLLPQRVVRQARRRLLTELADLGVLAESEKATLSDGCLQGEVPMPSLLRRLDLQALPEVRAVLEHAALFDATARLLETDEVVTTCYKWLRAVPPGAFTGPHMDRAYVGRSERRLTAWIPLGDVRCGQKELGSLCWLPGSHSKPQVVQRFKDYHQAGSDGERSGWLAADPAALQLPEDCRWESAHFAEGDVAIFGMDLLHSTLPNGSSAFRLSCDTRWQPLDAPPPEVHTGPWRSQEQPKPKRRRLRSRRCDDGAPGTKKAMPTETTEFEVAISGNICLDVADFEYFPSGKSTSWGIYREDV